MYPQSTSMLGTYGGGAPPPIAPLVKVPTSISSP